MHRAAMTIKHQRLALLLCLTLAFGGCDSSNDAAAPGVPAESSPRADTIWFNGVIITMDERQPMAKAVAVRNGKILLVGSVEDAGTLAGDDTQRFDLDGKTLLPGFFDSHSHATLTSAKLAVVIADPPPAGPADSIGSIQRVLRQRLESDPPPPGEWLVGWGYDNAMLAEGRHPTREDLDAVSNEIPIVLLHFSTHQVVVNSKGLELAGITADSEDPPGGKIGRLPGSREPDGILQETAQFAVLLPVLESLLVDGADIDSGEAPGEGALLRMDRAMQEYAARGFTTVTEMGASPQSMALLAEMARQQRLPVDVIAVGFSQMYSAGQISALVSRNYRNRYRIGGIKILLDGGSPGRSAFLLDPYFTQLPGEEGYRGYPHIAEQKVLDALLSENYRLDVPVYIHALGDAAVAQVLSAVRAAERAQPGGDRRTQLIHVQQATEQQLDALADLDVTLSFQVAHNFYFGDFHRDVIYGPNRTARLNPARSALDRDLSVSIHHDSPVHPIDQMMLIWAAVNRVTRSGQVIGPQQRITVLEALKASTLDAAFQFGEETSKGSIETGKLADFVILSDNPLQVDPMRLREIEVVETVKEGRSVYLRSSE